jgi:hypothetical protein
MYVCMYVLNAEMQCVRRRPMYVLCQHVYVQERRKLGQKFEKVHANMHVWRIHACMAHTSVCVCVCV